MNTTALLLLPFVLFVVVVLTRFVLLWIERRRIKKHAKNIYVSAINYIKGNEDPHDLEILATRQAFYSAVINEQKVYRELLKKLRDLLQTQEKTLVASFEYLDVKSE